MRHWDEFLEYISTVLNEPKDIVHEKIIKKLKDMVAAVLPLFPSSEHLPGATSLSGWDVIFDQHLNPWMMEINGKPDMQTSTSAISLFKIPLWSQAMELGLKIANRNTPPDFLGDWERISFN